MSEQSVSKRTDNRIIWLDVVRGILIVLMVFGHNIQFGSGSVMLRENYYFLNPIFRFIYSFHMPSLMLLSGFFFGFTVKKTEFWKNRIRSVFIPLVMWSTIPVGLSFIKGVASSIQMKEILRTSLSYYLSYYWFLWAILFSSVILWVIHTYYSDSSLIVLIIGVVFLFLPGSLNIQLYIFMYPYYAVGFLWNVKKVKLEWAMRHKGIVTGVVSLFYFSLLAFYHTDSFIYTTGITVRNLPQLQIDLYRYTIGFVGAAMVIWIVYIIYPKLNKMIVTTVLSHLGRISLTIYIIDSLLNSYVLPRLTQSFNLNYGVLALETVIILLFCVFVDWIIKKIPIARKVLLGSR